MLIKENDRHLPSGGHFACWQVAGHGYTLQVDFVAARQLYGRRVIAGIETLQDPFSQAQFAFPSLRLITRPPVADADDTLHGGGCK